MVLIVFVGNSQQKPRTKYPILIKYLAHLNVLIQLRQMDHRAQDGKKVDEMSLLFFLSQKLVQTDKSKN